MKILLHADLNQRSASFHPFAFADNQAAVASVLAACLGVVKDALEEMEHVRKPLSLWGSHGMDCNDGSVMEHRDCLIYRLWFKFVLIWARLFYYAWILMST